MARRRSIIAMISFLATSSMLTGCASILGGGGSQPVQITANRPGTQIHVLDASGKEIQTATAPCRVTLDRGRGYFHPASYMVRASLDGFSEQQIPIKPGLNPWYLGNLVFGGLVGMVVVDPLTGAMWTLPNEVKVDFNPPGDSLEKR